MDLAPGELWIIVTDARGCIAKFDPEIEAREPLTCSAATTAGACPGGGGQVTITATGGTPPYQYKLGSNDFQSSNVFDDVTAGEYMVTVRDANGCETTCTANVAATSGLVCKPSAKATSCRGGSDGEITVVPVGGVPPYQYKLSGGDYQSENVFKGLKAGIHWISIRDSRGCVSMCEAIIKEGEAVCLDLASNTVTANPTRNINSQMLAHSDVRLMPNPARSVIRVALTTPLAGFAQLRVLSIQGQQLISRQFDLVAGENAVEVDLGDLRAGTYLLSIEEANGTHLRKFVKLD
jgi:hypothetical protein